MVSSSVARAKKAYKLTVKCSDCGRNAHVRKTYRCYYCKGWFCSRCARKHFRHGLIEDFGLRLTEEGEKYVQSG